MSRETTNPRLLLVQSSRMLDKGLSFWCALPLTIVIFANFDLSQNGFHFGYAVQLAKKNYTCTLCLVEIT